MDNDNVIGNWPAEKALAAIPIRTRTVGSWRTDEYRAILLAMLEEDEGKRLYVGKRPQGMCPASVPALHALIYILAQDADWIVKRVDGECILRSAVQPDDVQLDFPSSLQPLSAPMTPPVCRNPSFHSCCF